MSAEERAHIDNAIWLCATHSRMIDRDEVTYTADVLRAMKREHEANCKNEQRNGAALVAAADLIAIGPDVVCVGEIRAVCEAEWSLHLQNFVDGDIHTLITFIDSFQQTAPINRYILVNALGDGRVLNGAPSMIKEQSGYIVRCPVSPRFPRIRAAELPRDFALSESHDLMAKNGSIAMVSGVDALLQRVKSCLSLQKGEMLFRCDFGARFDEYYGLLRGSPWLERFLKLDAIRQAAIPYMDEVMNRQYTPLLCVERVYGIEILAEAPTNKWLPVRVDLDVKGIGRWQHELSVCIPQLFYSDRGAHSGARGEG
jgi:hypothetical protein